MHKNDQLGLALIDRYQAPFNPAEKFFLLVLSVAFFQYGKKWRGPRNILTVNFPDQAYQVTTDNAPDSLTVSDLRTGNHTLTVVKGCKVLEYHIAHRDSRII